MSFELKDLKKTPRWVIVTIVHVIILVPIVVSGSKIKTKPREVKVRVNLDSGELMTAPEVGEPEIRAGGGEPEPPAPPPEPPPEPPKQDTVREEQRQRERQKKIAEQKKRERQKKIAEQKKRERQRKIAEQKKRERQRKIVEQRKIAERQRLVNQRREQERRRQRQAEIDRRRRQSGVHHDSSWDNPNNIPTGDRNRGQRRGEMKNKPKIGGDSRAEDLYFAGLLDFFKPRWSVPPGILAGEDSDVLVHLTVAADGRLLKWRLVERSPSQAVNASVEQMLRNLPRIPAPPNGAISFKIRLSR